MQADIGTLLIIAGLFLVVFHGMKRQSSVVVAPIISASDTTLADRLWTSIGKPGAPGERFDKRGVVTVTGTVVGKEPHFNTDGDLVFGLMPDAPFKNLLTAASAKHTISGGGLWCEAVCQKANTSSEEVHQGDCARGGPFPKFPTPKMGEKWSVTGLHVIDIREGGHAEIHPIVRMSKI